MKSSDLIRDPKAWLYFLGTALGAMAASQTFGWRAVCASLSAGFIAVKAYTSPPASNVPPTSPTAVPTVPSAP